MYVTQLDRGVFGVHADLKIRGFRVRGRVK